MNNELEVCFFIFLVLVLAIIGIILVIHSHPFWSIPAFVAAIVMAIVAVSKSKPL